MKNSKTLWKTLPKEEKMAKKSIVQTAHKNEEISTGNLGKIFTFAKKCDIMW